MATSGISIGIPHAATTLSGLKDSFATARQDQHLRFSDAKGLHTHGSLEFTKVDFLAKFRNADALQERADLRQNAIAQVKTAIDNEFGRGIAERVFARVGQDGVGQGSLLVSHLGRLSEAAHDIRQEDLAAANVRLGDGNSVGEVLTSTVAELGYDLSSLSQEQLAGLKHRMAEAILGLPQGSTGAQFERAAQGALIADQLERSVADLEAPEAGRGYTPQKKAELGNLIAKCFNPLPELPDHSTDTDLIKHHNDRTLNTAPVKLLSETLLSMSTAATETVHGRKLRPQVPPEKAVIDVIAQDRAAHGSKQENASQIHALIGHVTADACKHAQPEKSFMRGNDFSAVFEMVKAGFNPQFEDRFPAAIDALMTRDDGASGAVEFRAAKLSGGGADIETQQKRAAQAFEAFDRALTVLFGGDDEAAMQSLARRVPQETCDYMAAARDAIDAESGQQTEEVRKQLIRFADINFVALRTINPIIIDLAKDVIKTNPDLSGSLMNLSKFVQNCANGLDITKKNHEGGESLPPGQYIEDSARPIFNKWADNFVALTAELTARGRWPASEAIG